MSATYEKISGNKAKLSFTVPAAQFEEAMQKAAETEAAAE